MDLNEVKIASAKREQGDWVDSIPEMGDLRLKVRGIGNSDWRRLQTRLIEAVPRSKKPGGQIDPTEADRISVECMTETVLIDWANLTIGGQPVTYSKEKAREILQNPDYAPFRNAVAWAAAVVGDDNAAHAEEDAKN